MILNKNNHISTIVVLIAFIKCSKSYTHNIELLNYGEDVENYYTRNNIIRSNKVQKENITPEDYLKLNEDYIISTYFVHNMRLVNLNEDSDMLESYDVDKELEAFNDPQKNFYLVNRWGELLMKPKEVQEVSTAAANNKLAKIMKEMEEADDEGALEEYTNDSKETKAENDLLYFKFKLFPMEEQELSEYWVENKAALRKCAQKIGKEEIIDEINEEIDDLDREEEDDEDFWFNDFKSSKVIGSEDYQIYSLRMLRLNKTPLTINLLDHFYPDHKESFYGNAPLSSMDYDPPDNQSAITHIISHCTNTDV